MPSDAELLQAFVDTRSEPAFTALVQRHLPLVYAVAWRQTGDAHRAEDVAQTVFTLLARKAPALRGHPTLAGWLHTSTAHAAAKVRRTEHRRLRREQESLAMENDPAPDSALVEAERLRPLIDDALGDLKETDRTAVLLRYFDHQAYAVIGAQLGVSENTVRMRVDRALERLRGALSKRGIDSSSAAIGLALAAQTAGAVPAGLATSIASAALATSAAGSLVFFMSATFLKNSAIAAVVVAGATGLFLQQQEIEKLRADNARLMAAARPATKPLAIAPPPKPAVDPAARSLEAELARLRAQVAQLKNNPANSWQERVGLLKEVLEQLPEQNIPEIALASEDDWLDAAKAKLETADDYRRALSKLRNLCVGKFVEQLQPALEKFIASHNGQFPTSVSELQNLTGRMSDRDDAIWGRYIVAPAQTVSNVGVGGKWIIIQASVVDPTFDAEVVIGPMGHGTTTFGVSAMTALENAYQQRTGKPPNNPSALLPYATTPREKAALAAEIERHQAKQSARGK